MAEPLSARLWGSIDRIYAAIAAHPLVRGLADGSLERESFVFYVVQDALFLREYARALSLCAAKAPAVEDVELFGSHAAAALAAERSLHEAFFADFGLSREQVYATQPAPTNLAYTSFLLASCHGGSFGEALAAVLPCYWIYLRVGEELLAQGSPDPLYRRWIETYRGADYGEAVRRVLELADCLGETLGEAEEERMRARFVQASRYEWLFFEMALRREAWPI